MDSSRQALQNNGKLFFKFQIRVRFSGRKLKNIETNREKLILTKVQCFVHQWIHLDNLYKLMENFFFQIFEFVFELLAENWKILKRIARRGYWSKCNVLYVNGFVLTYSITLWKIFKFGNHFFNWIQFFKIIAALGLCMRGVIIIL